jgi:hypothetical protein
MGVAGHPAGADTSYDQLLNAYGQYIPQITGSVNSAGVPAAQTALAASEATQPGYNALNQAQLAQYALPAAQVGQNVASSNAQAGAASNLNLLQGTGGQAAQAGLAVNQATNPLYYQNAQGATNMTSNLLNAINLNGLSPGEYNATERAQNQGNQGTGNLGLNNNTNTIANAMNFGGAFNNKLGIAANAIGTANNTANTTAGNAGFNGVNTALGTSQTNQGTSFVNPTVQNVNPNLTVGAIPGLSTNALTTLGGQAGINQGIQANSVFQNSTASGVAGGSSAAGQGANMCCFIFLESYNGKLPWFVRECRDEYYKQEPKVSSGYKKMAKWLVPLMKQYKTITQLVNYLMVIPITKFGGWKKNVRGYEKCKKYKFIKNFWFFVWRNI